MANEAPQVEMSPVISGGIRTGWSLGLHMSRRKSTEQQLTPKREHVVFALREAKNGEVAKWSGIGLQNRYTPVRIRSSPPDSDINSQKRGLATVQFA